MRIDGHELSPAFKPKHIPGLAAPIGFASCYGPEPDTADHRSGIGVNDEPWRAARDRYEQELKGFVGVVDDEKASAFHASMGQIRFVLGPTFGPCIAFSAHGRLYMAFPEYRVEDGLDGKNQMKGPRPLVYHLDGALKNPDWIDEIGADIAANLIGRGFGVAGPLTSKLPAELQRKNRELLAASIPTGGGIAELPIVEA